jgi:hypothetical protein
MLDSPSKQCVIVAPYYSEDDCHLLYSYPQCKILHTMFKNIGVRERLSDNPNIPIHVLVPHYFNSMVDFE